MIIAEMVDWAMKLLPFRLLFLKEKIRFTLVESENIVADFSLRKLRPVSVGIS